jgi:hypothetical protein
VKPVETAVAKERLSKHLLLGNGSVIVASRNRRAVEAVVAGPSVPSRVTDDCRELTVSQSRGVSLVS